MVECSSSRSNIISHEEEDQANLDKSFNLSSLHNPEILNSAEVSKTNVLINSQEETSTTCRENSESKESLTTTSDSAGQQHQLGYQLRALSDNPESLDVNLFQESSQLIAEKLRGESLSTELVNETLNYFVNCRQRLSQMTKTYDDSDAYILLLQEKEVDLELAARIGQDLLKQNKQLKESIKSLEEELAKRQDDVQQLRHELASKISLLDTFIEEEEHQHRQVEQNRSLQHDVDADQDQYPSSSSGLQLARSLIRGASSQRDDDDDYPSGFLSLTPHKPNNSIDPFTSLPYHINTTSYIQEQKSDKASRECNSAQAESCSYDKQDNSNKSTDQKSQQLIESVTQQLVESNKRLCELQDELLFKGEQSLLQQEKIFGLEQQIRDTDRRLDDIAGENETLRKSILDSTERQRELCEELKASKSNFSELLSVFLEFQKESQLNRSLQQRNSMLTSFCGQPDHGNHITDISFNSFEETPPPKINQKNLASQQQSTGFCELRDKVKSLDDSYMELAPSATAHTFTIDSDEFHSAQSSDFLVDSDQFVDSKCVFCCSNCKSDLNREHPTGRRNLMTAPENSIIAQERQTNENWMVASSLHEELRQSLQLMGESSEQDEEHDGRNTAAEEGDDEEDGHNLESGAQSSGTVRSSHASRSPKHRRGQTSAASKDQLQHQLRPGACSSNSDQAHSSDSDGADSGLHTTNLSNSATPHFLNTDNESDDLLLGPCSSMKQISHLNRANNSSNRAANNDSSDRSESGKKSWLGFSSFMIATIVIIFISASFNSSTNSNLAQRLQQIKIDR